MSNSNMRVVGPMAVAGLVGCAVLGVVGFAAGYTTRAPEVQEVLRAPTAAELEAACAPDLEEAADELTTAQAKVSELERETAVKERRVNELEAQMARGAEVGKALRAELAQLKTELAETKQQLVIAEEEKERLLVELTSTQEELHETKEELVVTRTQRDEAREDALYNRWQDFLHGSQLEICEKGSRKKLGNCRQTVVAALEGPARQDRFAHCIRSGQAQPMVRELDKGATLPEFSEMMNEEAKQVKGWFIEFCDPTLPELSDAALAEGRLPKTKTSEEG